MRTKLRALCLVVIFSGAGLAMLSYRAATRGTGGSVQMSDPEYKHLPPGSQAECLDGFTLTERSGKKMQWGKLDGRVRVVSFFFSSCPSSCLQQNFEIKKIQEAYAGKKVVFLSITCDPDIDSPDRLCEYANKFDAPPQDWLFLTGSLPYIRRVANDVFTVPLDNKTHSDSLIVADFQGQIRGRFQWNRPDRMTQMRILLDTLLSEPAPNSEEGQAKGYESNNAETVNLKCSPLRRGIAKLQSTTANTSPVR